jgi:hypothetical protein
VVSAACVADPMNASPKASVRSLNPYVSFMVWLLVLSCGLLTLLYLLLGHGVQ